MKKVQIKELTNEEFMIFFVNYPNKSLYQTPEYAFIMNKQGFESVFIGLVDQNKVLAATLLLVKKEHGFKYGFAPRGFLIDYNDFKLVELFTKGMKQFCNSKDIIAIKVNPPIIRMIYNNQYQPTFKNSNYDMIFDCLKHLGYYHLGYNNFFESLKPRFEAVISLHQPLPTLFRNIKKEYRTKIRSSEISGVKIYKGNQDQLQLLYEQTKQKYPRDLQYFKDCYRYFSKQHHIDFFFARLDTKEYLKRIQKLYEEFLEKDNLINEEVLIKVKENNPKLINKKMRLDQQLERYRKQLIYATNLLRDYPEGIVTATALIIHVDKEAYLMIDGMDDKYKIFNSKHLLLWKLMERYHGMQFQTFNLGGMSNLVQNNQYEGLNNFKLRFHPNVIEYIGDLELITNKTLYHLYRNGAPLRNMIKSKLTK